MHSQTDVCLSLNTFLRKPSRVTMPQFPYDSFLQFLAVHLIRLSSVRYHLQSFLERAQFFVKLFLLLETDTDLQRLLPQIITLQHLSDLARSEERRVGNDSSCARCRIYYR